MKTWIILFILFLGLLLTFGSFVYASRYLSRISQIENTRRELNFIQGDLNQYEEVSKTYPSTAQGLEALVERPTSAPLPEDWVQSYQEVPVDLWQKPYRYQFPGTKDPTRPEIISAGPDGVFGTEDDLSSQE